MLHIGDCPCEPVSLCASPQTSGRGLLEDDSEVVFTLRPLSSILTYFRRPRLPGVGNYKAFEAVGDGRASAELPGPSGGVEMAADTAEEAGPGAALTAEEVEAIQRGAETEREYRRAVQRGEPRTAEEAAERDRLEAAVARAHATMRAANARARGGGLGLGAEATRVPARTPQLVPLPGGRRGVAGVASGAASSAVGGPGGLGPPSPEAGASSHSSFSFPPPQSGPSAAESVRF